MSSPLPTRPVLPRSGSSSFLAEPTTPSSMLASLRPSLTLLPKALTSSASPPLVLSNGPHDWWWFSRFLHSLFSGPLLSPFPRDAALDPAELAVPSVSVPSVPSELSACSCPDQQKYEALGGQPKVRSAKNQLHLHEARRARVGSSRGNRRGT